MKILDSILGDQLMVDSAQDPLRPMIVCPSTIISSNPAKVMLWRNYNYPPGHQSRYALRLFAVLSMLMWVYSVLWFACFLQPELCFLC